MSFLQQGSALTLWDEALPPDKIPKYPTFDLRKARGGETTYFIAQELKLSETLSLCRVEARPAVEGELLRDPEMKFVPDWTENLRYRIKIIATAQADPKLQELHKSLCKSSILYFVNTFAYCYEPRATDPERRNIPFVTFPFQDEVLTWMVWCISMRMEGIVAKSRDMGATWMLIAVIDWLSIFYRGNTSYLTSLREEDVDNRMPDSLFGKLRYMHMRLPDWLQCGWTDHGERVDRMNNIEFPETGAYIRGQKVESTGGRQGRATILGVDEFAHVTAALTALAAFSALAPTIFYISTPEGPGNPFAVMAQEVGANVKRLHWKDHPLKNAEWKKVESGKPKYFNPAIWAQEQEIVFETSKSGRVYEQLISFEGPDTLWCHIQRGAFVQYDPSYDVYSFSDLGGNDPCSTLFAQVKPIPPEFHHLVPSRKCLVLFGEYEGKNMTAYCLRWYLNSRGYRYAAHIVDLRTGNQSESSGKSWIKNLRDPNVLTHMSQHFGKLLEVGPPIHAEGKRNWEQPTIDIVNQALSLPGVIAINALGCPHLILAMQAWAYPVDRDTQEKLTGSSPNHDQWSHAGKALAYGVDWLSSQLMLVPPLAQKTPVNWGRLKMRQTRFK